MKKLSSNQMAQVCGGGFWDLFCDGVFIATLAAPNPVAGGLAIGCGIFTLAKDLAE